MKRFFLTAGIFIGLFFSAEGVSAQLLMEKSRVDITVEPGQTIVDSIYLHNTSDQPTDVKVYWQDFEYEPPFDGKKKFLPIGTSIYSMGSWMSFSPQEFSLPPLSKQTINYSMQVPPTAQGGYYGVLFFEQGGSDVPLEGTGVNIITRIGSLFFVKTKGQVKDLKMGSWVSKLNGLRGSMDNKGNAVMFPFGTYYVMDKDGLVADRGELKKIYIPPGQKADFEVNFRSGVTKGEYTMVLTFDLGEGDSLVQEVDFRKEGGTNISILGVRD
jgi:hypothetical protein